MRTMISLYWMDIGSKVFAKGIRRTELDSDFLRGSRVRNDGFLTTNVLYAHQVCNLADETSKIHRRCCWRLYFWQSDLDKSGGRLPMCYSAPDVLSTAAQFHNLMPLFQQWHCEHPFLIIGWQCAKGFCFCERCSDGRMYQQTHPRP